MDFNIMLSPEEVQNLLDCIDIIPSNHYMSITKNVDTNKIYVSDCGRDGTYKGSQLEITNHEEI